MVTNSPQTTIVADSKGHIASVNQAGLNFFGYSESQLLGQPLTTLMLPAQQAEHTKVFSQQKPIDYISNVIGKTIELPAKKSDGSVLEISLTVSEYSENNQKYYIGHITDLSKIIQKQHEVESINQSLSSILNHSKDFIFLMDRQGVYLDVFTASKEHLFLPYEKIVGSHYSQCLPPTLTEKLKELLSVAQIQQREQIMEYSNLTSSGEAFYYQAVINAFELPNQESGFIVIVRDVTDLKKAQHEAELAEKIKTDFISAVSHDLRIWLNNVLSSMKLAFDLGASPEEISKYLGYINISLDNMMKLLNSILDLSKLEAHQYSLHLEETALNTELSALISPFYAQAKEKQIHFTKKVESSVSGKVVCDWNLISQILINLLSNAMKFTPKHGHVDVVVSVDQENDTDAKLNFSVSDTGPGIPAESMPKIFEPFGQLGNNQTKNKGTGLGLTLAQKKAQLMGGAIDVKSAVGRGSVFTLSVPIKLEQKKQIEKLDSASIISDFKNLGNFFNNRMVIFEDEEITALLMQTWFKKAGFNDFKIITSPEDFHDFISENSFADYPLFIVDKNIGDLDGAQVVQDLRSFPGASKKTIVMNSGDPLDAKEEKTLGKLLDGFDLKPIDYAALFKKLEKLGRERSANP